MPATYRKVHYTLRHRVIASLSQRLDGITYVQRHGLSRGMKRQGGLGFLPAFLAGGSAETPEEKFLGALDLTGKVVFEFGAFQGLLTLYFSNRAKKVIAYEPNPASYERVLRNVRLNGRENVELRNLAVGEFDGRLTLVVDPLMPGGASGDPAVAHQIRATMRRADTVTVRVVRVDDEIGMANLPLPDFIKIDVEGMELAALRGMARTLSSRHPELYIEMHGATLDDKEHNVRAIVQFVNELGYATILHVESGQRITPSNATRGREGHLYCCG